MFYKAETEYGTISITKAVIGKIITEAVDRLSGKVYICNQKGKIINNLFSRLGYFDDASNIEINYGPMGLDIRLYIVVRFGTSITKVTNQLIDEIETNIREFTSIELNSVSVVVAGTLSRQIKKRHIEVKR